MNKTIYLTILLLTCKICVGQNFVPNGDFEQYSGCPSNLGHFDSLLHWFNPCLPPYGGTGTNSGSPDYFNVCAGLVVGIPSNYYGYQYAHSGVGYSGIIPYSSVPDFREYMEVPLISPLVANTNYHFQMYVNVADRSAMAIDTISVYFSDVAIANLHSHEPLPYTPQLKIAGYITDTLNWIPVSGNYTATGGENYILIGNFNDDNNTNMIALSGNYATCFFYIDDVSLMVTTAIDEQDQNDEIKIYPNPAIDQLNIVVNSNDLSEIIIYDITSKIIVHQTFIKSVTLNTEQLTKGIYIYEVRYKNGLYKQGKVVKD